MELTILGCHSATPRENKQTTAQLLEVGGHLFLIDCGEGTQMQLRKAKVKFSRIKHIFISHLHGDHFYGLVGLISTFRLLGRTAPLHIYGPKGIKEVITLQLKLAHSWTDYPLHFTALEAVQPQLLLEDKVVKVSTIPLDHRIYTNGFLFETQLGLRKIDKLATAALDLTPEQYQQLQLGVDLVLASGEKIRNEQLTQAPQPIKRYAFCSDTGYFEQIISQINGVDLLYHEATFLDDHADLAEKTKHSTVKQAATIAQKAGVKKLMIGHYSSRYKDKEVFLEEGKTVFEPIVLAEDLKRISI
jgi:ribonuclease Z